ncbi:hypothetical protein BJY00DRAFT_292174 [Aspergillus carlsbadensis]|nr:hypothetical protein BJY00DRAFT_292174 [Aspergillus carlsbadensis]
MRWRDVGMLGEEDTKDSETTDCLSRYSRGKRGELRVSDSAHPINSSSAVFSNDIRHSTAGIPYSTIKEPQQYCFLFLIYGYTSLQVVMPFLHAGRADRS